MTPLSVRLLLYKSYLWQFLYGMMRLLYFTIIIISKEILSIQICSPNCKYTRQEIAKSTLLDNLLYHTMFIVDNKDDWHQMATQKCIGTSKPCNNHTYRHC
eukprot:312967_1